MYRLVLVCSGIPAGEGPEAAQAITAEFADHRTHHQNVICSYSDGKLTLVAENDFDPNGLALMDEFSDCLSAFISTPFDGDLRVQSIARL
jgi:hypothetical protein